MKAYTIGIEIKRINRDNKIFFGSNKILYFEIVRKKTSENITGSEAGLEANRKKNIKNSSK